MGISQSEICHSNMLAWLLDHRIDGWGTHAQGKLGVKLFLEEFGAELGDLRSAKLKKSVDDSHYWVYTEATSDESRVDIEIAARGSFLIHIENKILSSEGEDQTDREWRDLLARQKELNVPNETCHAIYLTLDGSNAKNANFSCFAWRRIANVLDRFADGACPADVKLFARHCAKTIRKLSAAEHEEREDEDADV
jgi:hypothetical protein